MPYVSNLTLCCWHTSAIEYRGRTSMSENLKEMRRPASAATSGWDQFSYLNLIGDDDAGSEFFANLVHSFRIEVAQAEQRDLALSLQVLQMPQSSEVSMIIVVLPVELWFPKSVQVSYRTATLPVSLFAPVTDRHTVSSSAPAAHRPLPGQAPWWVRSS